jgi:hypothetical protein
VLSDDAWHACILVEMPSLVTATIAYAPAGAVGKLVAKTLSARAEDSSAPRLATVGADDPVRSVSAKPGVVPFVIACGGYFFCQKQ